MSKLLDHFKRMQEMCAEYVAPGTYINHDGTMFANSAPKLERAWAFANDMIYMLDGPEQREAQAEAEALDAPVVTAIADLQAKCDQLSAELANARAMVDEYRDNRELLTGRLAVANSDRDRATKKLDVVKSEKGAVIDALESAKRRVAYLEGYIDRANEKKHGPRTSRSEGDEGFYIRGRYT